jgi:hypothetical protein
MTSDPISKSMIHQLNLECTRWQMVAEYLAEQLEDENRDVIEIINDALDKIDATMDKWEQ